MEAGLANGRTAGCRVPAVGSDRVVAWLGTGRFHHGFMRRRRGRISVLGRRGLLLRGGRHMVATDNCRAGSCCAVALVMGVAQLPRFSMATEATPAENTKSRRTHPTTVVRESSEERHKMENALDELYQTFCTKQTTPCDTVIQYDILNYCCCQTNFY